MVFFGSKRHGDDVARAWIEECAADPGRENAPRQWIAHFKRERAGQLQTLFRSFLDRRGYAYFPARATAERAARCFLETGSIEQAQKVKPFESELFRPEF